eukprot:3593541-Prymnesium_polylepis.1
MLARPAGECVSARAGGGRTAAEFCSVVMSVAPGCCATHSVALSRQAEIPTPSPPARPLIKPDIGMN